MEAPNAPQKVINDEQFTQKDKWATFAYAAKNVLICNMFNKNLHQSNKLGNEEDFKALKSAVFSLNDGQKAVFADKGKDWDARLNIDDYQHWYKDNEDTTHVDQVSKGQWLVKYIGSNPDSVKDLRYEYTGLRHGTGHHHNHLISRYKLYGSYARSRN